MSTMNSNDCQQKQKDAVIVPMAMSSEVGGGVGGGGGGGKGGAGNPALKCTQCSDTFQDVMALLSHLDSHALSCPVCKKEFTTKPFLEHHMKAHSKGDALGSQNGGIPSDSFEEPQTEPNNSAETFVTDPITSDSLKEKIPETVNECEEEFPPSVSHSQNQNDEGTVNHVTSPTDNCTSKNPEMTQVPKSKPDNNSTGSESENEKLLAEKAPCKSSKDEANDPQNKVDLKKSLDRPLCEISTCIEEKNNNINDDGKCDSEEREMKSNCSVTSEESTKAKTEKPYKCSNCKYSAKCVASVHIHQRRNHPGEWTTVISTVPESEGKSGEEQASGIPKQSNSLSPGDSEDDEDDEEVRRALRTPVTESEEDGDFAEREFRCSMCAFTAKDTTTVFEHQRTVHPGEWQLNDAEAEGMEASATTLGTQEEEGGEDVEETLYQLPTELDQYSEMGRSIIAGTSPNASCRVSTRSTPSSSASLSCSSHLPGNQMQYWQGYNRLTGRFHCPNCPAYFYEPNQHTRHLKMCMKDHHMASQVGQYRCLLCKRVFPDMETLKPHMTSHQRYFRAFRCSCCGYNAKFEGTILAHIRQRHPVESGAFIERIAEPADIQNIPNKWEKIADTTGTGIEAEEVTDDPDLQRLFGGVAQYFPNDIRTGTPDIHDDSSNSLIDTDLQSQTSDPADEIIPEPISSEILQSLRVGNNYVCPECPVLFREPNKLRRHMDIHGGIKRHVCNICNKRFTRSEHLKRHRFVHATTKPYMCSICYYSSKRLDNLQKHQKVKHPGENYTVIRVSKEMIEAEIAANSDIQPAVPAAQPKALILAAVKAQEISPAQRAPHPFIISQPTSRPKRGRPRKISSPDEMFVFSRDPELVGTNTMTTTSSISGTLADVGISNMIQHDSPIRHTMSQGGIINLSNTLMNTVMPVITSTPIRNQNFNIANIAAQAAAEATTPITIAPVSDGEGDIDNSPGPASSQSSNNIPGQDPRDSESPKPTSGLINRGKYQCHVCDRPFSYLKPFKKHLLCHGTFMPYQCSICGHQSKRRDMMQDHQRENHPGASCDIQVMEPTADMHDMMDTYIQKQPSESSPQSANSSSVSASTLHSTYDERMVDPQVDVQSLGLNLPVKAEPQQAEQPQTEEVQLKSCSTPEVKEATGAKPDSIRSTSSPSVLSNAVPASTAGMVRPRPRRLIKFKVLSSHNRTPRPILPATMKPDTSSPSIENKVKDEEKTVVQKQNSSPMKLEKAANEVRSPTIKRAGDEAPCDRASKIMRMSGDEDENKSASSSTFQEGSSIGTAPRMSIMGLRPRQKLLTPKHYDIGFKITKDHKPGDIVVDLKSNKGTPKAKQGDNHRFSCSVCDQRFAYEKPFKRHLLVHGGFEPYRCNVCGHQTTSRDTMKIHQNKGHQNVRNAGITVLDPTPEMEQSLIRQGLLQPSQPVSDEEDAVASKSIVETARIEQHIMANAMKTLSATVKGKKKERSQKDDQTMPSFHALLGLKPTNQPGEKEEEDMDESQEGEEGMSIDQDSSVTEYDDISDMPVDEALFANMAPGSSLIIEPRGPGYECEFCGKAFQCSSKLQRHLVTHTGMKAYECQICFKKLTRLEHLKRHLLTHGNLKPYRCSLCKFDAKRLDIVQLHQQTNHPGEPVEIQYLFTPSVMTADRFSHQHSEGSQSHGADFTCSMCGSRFSDMGQLMMHQKLHSSGQKPYECFICHKTFTRPEHLKRHRLVHDDTKPFRCSECGFKTKRLDGMREHQRSRHPSSDVFIIDTILPDNPTVKRKRGRPPKFGPRDSLDGLQLMHCDKCCLAFYDQGRFEQHKMTHVPSPPKNQELTCHLCGVRVSQAKHLRRHMLLHQDHIPYQCSLCGYAAKRTDHMKLHFRKSHPDGQPRIIYVSKDGPTTSGHPMYIKQEPDDALADYFMPGDSFMEGHSDTTGNSSTCDQSYLSDHGDFYNEGSYVDGSNSEDVSNIIEEMDGGEGEEMAGKGAAAFTAKSGEQDVPLEGQHDLEEEGIEPKEQSESIQTNNKTKNLIKSATSDVDSRDSEIPTKKLEQDHQETATDETELKNCSIKTEKKKVNESQMNIKDKLTEEVSDVSQTIIKPENSDGNADSTECTSTKGLVDE